MTFYKCCFTSATITNQDKLLIQLKKKVRATYFVLQNTVKQTLKFPMKSLTVLASNLLNLSFDNS